MDTDSWPTVEIAGSGSGENGIRSYLLPVPEQGLMQLFIWVPNDGHFALTAEFSTEVSTPDAQITTACDRLSECMSLYLNADQGYQRGEVSAEEWRTQIDQALAIVTELQDTATGLIGLEVPALVAGMSSAAVVPGYFPAGDQDGCGGHDRLGCLQRQRLRNRDRGRLRWLTAPRAHNSCRFSSGRQTSASFRHPLPSF